MKLQLLRREGKARLDPLPWRLSAFLMIRKGDRSQENGHWHLSRRQDSACVAGKYCEDSNKRESLGGSVGGPIPRISSQILKAVVCKYFADNYCSWLATDRCLMAPSINFKLVKWVSCSKIIVAWWLVHEVNIFFIRALSSLNCFDIQTFRVFLDCMSLLTDL